MKRIVLSLIIILNFGVISAQNYKVNLNAISQKNFESIKIGDSIKIREVIHKTGYTKSNGEEMALYEKIEDNYLLVINNCILPITGNLNSFFKFQYKTPQDVWNAKIITDVLCNLKERGIQNELRTEMEIDALEYIYKVKEYGLEFTDPYLENYIYSLIAKIAPTTIIDGRPGNINLLILEDSSLNACIYPNGTLVINTGLLSVLHSEDELVAILSHEIAHFILDHSVDNINKAKARQKRAEFWAAVATGVTAVAEGVVASQNRYYIPGAATLGVAMAASAIASNVIERLGMQYNQKQENEADKLAIQILELLNYDKNALATALSRIEQQMIIERSNAMFFASYTHPALIERINNAGKIQNTKSSHFEKEISFAVTSTARMKFEDRRFREALTFATQNIENNVATAEDYIIKANCLLALHNDSQSNNQILELISCAKTLEPTNINIYKAEILANLRLGDRNKAIELLTTYSDSLTRMQSQLTDTESDNTWDTMNKFINTELSWSNKMKIKLHGM